MPTKSYGHWRRVQGRVAAVRTGSDRALSVRPATPPTLSRVHVIAGHS